LVQPVGNSGNLLGEEGDEALEFRVAQLIELRSIFRTNLGM